MEMGMTRKERREVGGGGERWTEEEWKGEGVRGIARCETIIARGLASSTGNSWRAGE